MARAYMIRDDNPPAIIAKYLDVFRSVVPSFSAEQMDLPFGETGLDRSDLVAIRVDLEQMIGRPIPEAVWIHFECLQDAARFCEAPTYIDTVQDVAGHSLYRREVAVNMPQMAVEALSESWLLKELGQIHWDMLGDALCTPCFQLRDAIGNRLYATFVRIRISCSNTLAAFVENDRLNIEGRLTSSGNGMYFSEIVLRSHAEEIKAELLTRFSIRHQSDNRKLSKTRPDLGAFNGAELQSGTAFGSEYRLMKKEELQKVRLMKAEFRIQQHYVYEREYQLNPYYDLNGLGLLYFAAYPIIAETCESSFFNQQMGWDKRWELQYAVKARDIFYYANCNIDDAITFRLHSYEFKDGEVWLSSSLYRNSDEQLLARIFTVKGKRS